MKWDELISLRLSELVVRQMALDPRLQLKQSEEAVRRRVELKINENFAQEKQLVEEVYQTMENLENQGHQFERQKMFPLLKAQIAKKKGFVL